MTYRVELASAAARQLRKLDWSAADRIIRTLGLLAEEPRPPAAQQLVGHPGVWRVRTGDYRILYQLEDDVLLVWVVRVARRRDVYER